MQHLLELINCSLDISLVTPFPFHANHHDEFIHSLERVVLRSESLSVNWSLFFKKHFNSKTSQGAPKTVSIPVIDFNNILDDTNDALRFYKTIMELHASTTQHGKFIYAGLDRFSNEFLRLLRQKGDTSKAKLCRDGSVYVTLPRKAKNSVVQMHNPQEFFDDISQLAMLHRTIMEWYVNHAPPAEFHDLLTKFNILYKAWKDAEEKYKTMSGEEYIYLREQTQKFVMYLDETVIQENPIVCVIFGIHEFVRVAAGIFDKRQPLSQCNAMVILLEKSIRMLMSQFYPINNPSFVYEFNMHHFHSLRDHFAQLGPNSNLTGICTVMLLSTVPDYATGVNYSIQRDMFKNAPYKIVHDDYYTLMTQVVKLVILEKFDDGTEKPMEVYSALYKANQCLLDAYIFDDFFKKNHKIPRAIRLFSAFAHMNQILVSDYWLQKRHEYQTKEKKPIDEIIACQIATINTQITWLLLPGGFQGESIEYKEISEAYHADYSFTFGLTYISAMPHFTSMDNVRAFFNRNVDTCKRLLGMMLRETGLDEPTFTLMQLREARNIQHEWLSRPFLPLNKAVGFAVHCATALSPIFALDLCKGWKERVKQFGTVCADLVNFGYTTDLSKVQATLGEIELMIKWVTENCTIEQTVVANDVVDPAFELENDDHLAYSSSPHQLSCSSSPSPPIPCSSSDAPRDDEEEMRFIIQEIERLHQRLDTLRNNAAKPLLPQFES